ncbi:MAG: apolipoprotein N-acyltransferase [Pseudomonadota bacterium]
MEAPTGRITARVAALPYWGKDALALGVGAVGSFGLAPYGFAPLMVLSMFLSFLLFESVRRPQSAFRLGWVLGFAYFGLSLSWIIEPFQVDAAQHAWMAPFALFFLAGGLALFWGGAFALARWCSGRLVPLVFAWPLGEMARAYVLTGFPWASPPQAMIDGLGGQFLSIGGPHGLMLAMAFAVYWLAVPGRNNIIAVIQIVSAISLTALIMIPPVFRDGPATKATIRIVQPNAPQDEKWDPEKIPVFLERQLEFTAAEGSPDLVLWPETALPYLVEYADSVFGRMADASNGAPIVVGIQRREGDDYYNGLVVLDEVGAVSASYDKHHLVPFGEYMPAEWLFRRINVGGLAARAEGGYASGPGPRVLDLGPVGRALPLICYEAVFAHEVNNAPSRPDFLMQLTNDAWFGDFAGPQQHLSQARMRAIEQGLPMVRSANTGISAMIDPYGRVLKSLPLNTSGYIDARLPRPNPKTPYAIAGDLPWLGIMLFGLTVLRLRSRQNFGFKMRLT